MFLLALSGRTNIISEAIIVKRGTTNTNGLSYMFDIQNTLVEV